ncbi:uncharacterized protein C3B8.09 [Cyclospora cayetanensis]|uniref:Uncharacterized protein C3B8.09 n=1 Tax=Cyclospora cayetanensis TaxID=88456 RepID=A0A6P6RQ51_9EIME|nr:uncharacterized protein C3B8.09 [Cyclospora cayetanensis]
MAKGKRGSGRTAAQPSRPSGTSTKAERRAASSVLESSAIPDGELSDGSADFLPLTGGRDDEESSEYEALLMRQMGLEGAEDAADEEDSGDGTGEGTEDNESDEGQGAEAGSDDGESTDDGEARTAWGRRAKDFYGGSSSDESSEDEEELQLQVAEAVRVNEVEDVEGMQEEHFGADPRALEGLRKLLDMQGKSLASDKASEKAGDEKTEQEFLWQARLDAEVGAILDGFSMYADQQHQKAQAAVVGLSKEELEKVVASAHPELQGLLRELREALKEVNEKVMPLVALARSRKFLTREGVSLFDTKNQLLLSYLSYLSYYVVLKAHGVSIASHPVVERLIESRLLLQKIRPVEAALKPQLEQLLLMGREEGSKASAAAPRARPEAFAAVGESDEDAEEPDFQKEGTEDGESGSDGEAHTDVQTYKAPKMLAMEYTQDKVSAKDKAARELQRAAARLQKSELVRAVRAVAGDAPEEIGIERWLAAKAHGQAVREAGLLGASKFDDDDQELEMMRRSLSKKERKAQAAQRALFERRAAAAVGSTLEDLAIFADESIALEDDGLESVAGPIQRTKARGALGHYLNAAKQAADEAAKTRKANAEKLVLSRQQNVQHLSRRVNDTGRHRAPLPSNDVEPDEEFEALAGEARRKKELKKKRMQEKAMQFLPQIEEEVSGQRGITREIEKNKGLIRKRKKFEGNARVHNRMKYQQKSKKLKSIRPEMRAVEDRNYEGETSGIRTNLKKSRTLR